MDEKKAQRYFVNAEKNIQKLCNLLLFHFLSAAPYKGLLKTKFWIAKIKRNNSKSWRCRRYDKFNDGRNSNPSSFIHKPIARRILDAVACFFLMKAIKFIHVCICTYVVDFISYGSETPFTNAVINQFPVSLNVRDALLEKKYRQVIGLDDSPDDRLPVEDLNRTSYHTDETIDEMLLGNLDEDAQKFADSLIDKNAEFILDLFWRYLPIPLSDLANVLAVVESPYHRLEPTNAAFRTAAAWFAREILSMEIVNYFSRIYESKYQPVFSMSFEYHSLETSIELIKQLENPNSGMVWSANIHVATKSKAMILL